MPKGNLLLPLQKQYKVLEDQQISVWWSGVMFDNDNKWRIKMCLYEKRARQPTQDLAWKKQDFAKVE